MTPSTKCLGRSRHPQQQSVPARCTHKQPLNGDGTALGRKNLSAVPSSFSPINHQQKENTMADYFTNFSVVLKLANETEQAYALDLAHKASLAQQGDELPADFPKALVDMIEDWHFETVADDSGTTHGLWLHSMYGGVDAVCLFIQHLLQKFDQKGCVTFE
jgi:hypothetical protein